MILLLFLSFSHSIFFVFALFNLTVSMRVKAVREKKKKNNNKETTEISVVHQRSLS